MSKLFRKILESSVELHGEELEDFLWENSRSGYDIDNYTMYHMEEQVNVLYDAKKGEIAEVTG
jgi:hypothetical protein